MNFTYKQEMEPEAVWLQDGVFIKEESHTEMEQDKLNCELKHEENATTSEDDILCTDTKQGQLDCKLKCEENALISEDNIKMSAMAMKNEYNDELETEELIMKFEEGTQDVNFETTEVEEKILSDTSRFMILDKTSEHCSPQSVNMSELCVSQLGETQQNNRLGAPQYLNSCSISDDSVEIQVPTDTSKYSCTCEICNKSFTTHSHLKVHMRIHTGHRPYKCKICNKSFIQRGQVAVHLRTHTGQRPFTCEICNKSFTQRGDLNKHKHTHTGLRPYNCDICKLTFTQQGSLKRHMDTHTGLKPHSCEICNKSFRLPEYLKRHMQEHRDPYVCEICNQSFWLRGNLKVHMRRHFGQRLYTCEICNKSFTQSGTVKIHMRIHTDQRPFSCEICSRSFTQRFCLKRHMRIHRDQQSRSQNVSEQCVSQSDENIQQIDKIQENDRLVEPQCPNSSSIANESFLDESVEIQMPTDTEQQ